MKRAVTKENMTKSLITIKWNYPMEQAYQTMEEKRIRHLPVVDETGVVVGILSRHDVERAMNPNRPGFSPSIVAGDYMSWPAISVSENSPVKDVAEGMIDEKVSCFLVENKNGQAVGIITTEDLLKLLYKMLANNSSTLESLSYTPLVAEALREIESAGI